jgi:diphthamide biosynthesis protein 7
MKNLFDYDTIRTACSVEWSPIHRNQFVCGTYQLESQDKRLGSIILFEREGDEVRHVKTIDTSGTLDCKYSWKSGNVALATADGILSILSPTLDTISTCDLSNKMCLSVDWSSRRDHESEKIAISHYNGTLSLVSQTESELIIDSNWKCHDFEAWIAAFNYEHTSIVYTGGDDAIFNGWDLQSQKRIFRSNEHQAGVTCIQMHPTKNLIATGSYDEQIRIWDPRNMKRPISTTSLEGGIWRIKWHETTDQILTACMHNGFKILDLDGTNVSEVTHFTDHKSLAYGCDWCLEDPSFVASCSFYDHSLKFWKY